MTSPAADHARPPQPSPTPTTGRALATLAAQNPTPITVDPPTPTPQPPVPPVPPVPPAARPTPRTIALINQKGGVGKTTTTANLGAALADAGQRVLLIDLDPQAHLTLHLGLDPTSLEHTTYELLTDPDTSAAHVAQQVRENLAILPAQVNLAGAESELAALATEGRAQTILRDKIRPLIGDDQWFDIALIDCPPSLGLLTVSALAAATEVIVPMQAHFLALQGLSELLKTVQRVNESLNPTLTVSGVILCMHEGHTILATEVANDLAHFLEQSRNAGLPWSDAQLLGPPIRRNIKLAESPSFGATIFDYAPKCPGADDYRSLAQSILNIHQPQPAGT